MNPYERIVIHTMLSADDKDCLSSAIPLVCEFSSTADETAHSCPSSSPRAFSDSVRLCFCASLNTSAKIITKLVLILEDSLTSGSDSHNLLGTAFSLSLHHYPMTDIICIEKGLPKVMCRFSMCLLSIAPTPGSWLILQSMSMVRPEL